MRTQCPCTPVGGDVFFLSIAAKLIIIAFDKEKYADKQQYNEVL